MHNPDSTIIADVSEDWPYGYGFCHCGCGQRTQIADRTRPRWGYVKGEPRRYVINHQKKGVPWKRIEERFWANVDRDGPNECWLWMGACRPTGYGLFRWNQRHDGAHRASWEMANSRPVPNGLYVLHHCDNPRCVNPEHLFIGSHTDNMRDMLAKGRGRWAGHVIQPRRALKVSVAIGPSVA